VRVVLGPVIAAVLLTACSAPAVEREPKAALPTAIPPSLQLPDRPTGNAWRGLALVPADAEVVTLTDYDVIRARFGVPNLTSDDLMSDRTAFWERAEVDAVLLADGVLRADHSRLWLDHGFSQDDVDWEVHFTGAAGPGYVVAFRAGLDMSRVEAALGERSLRGATVLADKHLLVKGVAAEGERVWASEPLVPDLVDDGAESAYLRRGCVPVRTALGDRATYADQERLLAEQDPRYLRPLDAFSVSFAGPIATARLGLKRIDLLDRADLTEAWPASRPAPRKGAPRAAGKRAVGAGMTFRDGFGGDALVDPSTGRVGLTVTHPRAAAAVTLAELLPFAVCNEKLPIAAPTGTP
jgi:hypothetical protein